MIIIIWTTTAIIIPLIHKTPKSCQGYYPRHLPSPFLQVFGSWLLQWLANDTSSSFYRTRVWSLSTLVTHSLTDSLRPVWYIWLMWPWGVKMPTQNLLSLLLLLILIPKNVLTIDRHNFAADAWLRLWSLILVEILRLGLVKILKFKFSQDADIWLRFWSWCLV